MVGFAKDALDEMAGLLGISGVDDGRFPKARGGLGEREALSWDAERIVRTYSETVYRLAYAQTGNAFDADEIYQEVFFRMIRRNPRFRDEEHCKAWLLRVTVNCARKFHGSAWRKRTVPLDDETFLREAKAPERTDAIDLERELARLSPDARLLIHLYYYEELTTPEIAKLLRRRESTVRTQLTRARERLREGLSEDV